MEKLERILHAEDAARAAVAAARTEAQRVVGEASTASAATLRSGRELAVREAAALRGEVVARAHAEAGSLADDAARARATVLEDAGARTEAAVLAVLEVLKGR